MKGQSSHEIERFGENCPFKEYLKGKVAVKVGDVTLEKVDAIVNAANHTLMGGGGVDGAIHRRGGPRILEECKKIRREKFPDGLPDGEAIETTGGKLDAKYVIHTVGPVWNEERSEEDEKLENCYKNTLLLAEKLGCKTVAIPAISTGVYRFPKCRAAKIASQTIKEVLKKKQSKIEKVYLVFFSEEDAEIFKASQKF